MGKNTAGQEPVDCWNLGIQLDDTLTEPGLNIPDKQQDMQQPAASPVNNNNEDRFRILPRPARERRTWKRFVIDGAVVMLSKPSPLPVIRPAMVKLGPLKDIGMKGLAVHCVQKNEPAFNKARYLSLMHPEAGITVDGIPFKIVNSFKVADLPGEKEIWNLCISFEKLLPQQKVRLENLINDYGYETGNGQSLRAAGSSD